MVNDEQSQPLNIFDEIQGGSYTETISKIMDMSQGNEVLKDLLLLGFYQNPKREIHHKINSTHNKVINAGRKFNWHCEHDGCNKPSAYCHELSERAALSSLADDEGKVVILKRNLKNNSLEFIFDKIHVRDVLNFSGYCSEHDQSLFKSLDQPSGDVDLEYVNLQALRMMRRHKLSYQILIKVARDMDSEIQSLISELLKEGLDISELQEGLEIIHEIIGCNEELLSSACEFYDKLWAGIQAKNYLVDFAEFPCYKLGWAFSQTYDLVSQENGVRVFSFVFKMDLNGQPLLIHAWEKAAHIYECEGFDITPEKIIECLFLSKEKLVFSLDFLSDIRPEYLDYFLYDEQLYNNVKNPILLFLFKKIFFNVLEE